MPYDPGIQYRGDQYAFQGINNFGNSIAAGIDEFKKKREKTQKELAFADSVMEHAHATGRVSEEEYSKYAAANAGGKHSIALGTIANIADDFSREKFRVEREDADAARAQAFAIARMNEAGQNTRFGMAQANEQKDRDARLRIAEMSETAANARYQGGLNESEKDRQSREEIAKLHYGESAWAPKGVEIQLPEYTDDQGVRHPASTAPVMLNSPNSAVFTPGYQATQQALKKLTKPKTMSDLNKEVKDVSNGTIAMWANTQTTVGADGWRRGEYTDEKFGTHKLALPETQYQAYVKQFEALQAAGAGRSATGPVAQPANDQRALAEAALKDPAASEEHKKAARKILGLE